MVNSEMNRILSKEFEHCSIGILGFGREGRSSYRFLRGVFPYKKMFIIDSNVELLNDDELLSDANIELALGDSYLKSAENIDVIFKSPGVSFVNYNFNSSQKILSQTDLFLRFFGTQTIGVTGTKGKSTTVSLLKHILDGFSLNVLLIGNIGIPALDVVDSITEETIIVFELSSHQLEFVQHSPHRAILLNLFQEHLDHYKDYYSYRKAKWNIVKFQKENDYFIYCADEKPIGDDIVNEDVKSNILKYSFNTVTDNYKANKTILYSDIMDNGFQKDKFKLSGKHNLYNLMACLLAVKSMNLSLNKAVSYAMSFQGLPHRLEFVGDINGIRFYNDSIATIPQATIKALESFDDITTLVLGGFNRGIDYGILVDYLNEFRPLNLLLIGKVGDIIKNQLGQNYKGNLITIHDFSVIVDVALAVTPTGTACLLSPAASSYDSFKNFEERGNIFKKLVNAKSKN